MGDRCRLDRVIGRKAYELERIVRCRPHTWANPEGRASPAYTRVAMAASRQGKEIHRESKELDGEVGLFGSPLTIDRGANAPASGVRLLSAGSPRDEVWRSAKACLADLQQACLTSGNGPSGKTSHCGKPMWRSRSA